MHLINIIINKIWSKSKIKYGQLYIGHLSQMLIMLIKLRKIYLMNNHYKKYKQENGIQNLHTIGYKKMAYLLMDKLK